MKRNGHGQAEEKISTLPGNAFHAGNARELHQTTGERDSTRTTHQGVAISDHQNSLMRGTRGPTLFEYFVLWKNRRKDHVAA